MAQRKKKTNGKGRDRASAARDKLNGLRDELRAALKEREHVVDGAIAAAVAGEHVFLLGPPGTAKSMLSRLLARAFEGTYFEKLLTRYTEPNELFGPIDLRRWSEQGEYVRATAGYLPEAQFVFLDEVWKANSAILNSLLTAINERVFHDGGEAHDIPLEMVVSASNELPEGSELEAMFDRFAFRFDVRWVREPESFGAMLRGELPGVEARVDMDELAAARAAAREVHLGDDAIESLFKLRAALAREGVEVSDRSWVKIAGVLRSVAWLEGEDEVDPLHFERIVDCLWREPKQRPKIATVVAQHASPALADALEAHDAIMEQVNGLPGDGDLGPQGNAVVAELKKAIKQLEGKRDESSGPTANRIDELRERLVREHERITNRVMEEMGLGL